MGTCLITRRGTNNNLDFESKIANNYGSASFTLQDAYKNCLVIVFCTRFRDVSTDLSASVSSGSLTLLKSERPNVSTGQNMVVYKNIYKGTNISGKLSLSGGYGLGYTIVTLGNKDLSYVTASANNYGSASYTLPSTYKKCVLITSCARLRETYTDLSASVSSGKLKQYTMERPDVSNLKSSNYNRVTFKDLYIGTNISGKLSLSGGYGLNYILIPIS